MLNTTLLKPLSEKLITFLLTDESVSLCSFQWSLIQSNSFHGCTKVLVTVCLVSAGEMTLTDLYRHNVPGQHHSVSKHCTTLGLGLLTLCDPAHRLCLTVGL